MSGEYSAEGRGLFCCYLFSVDGVDEGLAHFRRFLLAYLLHGLAKPQVLVLKLTRSLLAERQLLLLVLAASSDLFLGDCSFTLPVFGEFDWHISTGLRRNPA